MGYMTELNTLLGLPDDFDPAMLEVGIRYSVVRPRERAFPLHIALLVVDVAWNFYGYAVAYKAVTEKGQTAIDFEMLSLFTEKEKIIYRNNFLKAARLTGEVPK